MTYFYSSCSVDKELSSSPRYVNQDLVIMTAMKNCDFHPLLNMLNGTDPNFPNGLDPNYCFPPKNRTLLQLASYYGDKDKVYHLISYGADVNAVDEDGNNAMLLAINLPEKYHNFKILRMLYANGTSIDHQNNKGWTALHRACILGDLKLISVVLSFKPDVYKLTDKNKVSYQLASVMLSNIIEIVYIK